MSSDIQYNIFNIILLTEYLEIYNKLCITVQMH